MTAEIRIWSLGLFATGVLARLISFLGLDRRPLPAPLALPDKGVLSFLISLVSLNLSI